MSYAVIVRQLAEQDIVEAQQWYDQQRTDLGGEFRAAIDELFTRLADSPLIYPIVHRNVRRAVLRRFPYLVFFVLTGDAVIVLARLHSSRDPRLQRARIR